MAPEIEQTPEFDKCIHHLRKFKTIEEDLARFKKALLANFPDLKPWGLDVKVVPGFGAEYVEVYKARKFRCEYLRSTEKIRVIYTYDCEKSKIIFIEIYFKGDRENHDANLVKRYLVKKNIEKI